VVVAGPSAGQPDAGVDQTGLVVTPPGAGPITSAPIPGWVPCGAICWSRRPMWRRRRGPGTPSKRSAVSDFPARATTEGLEGAVGVLCSCLACWLGSPSRRWASTRCVWVSRVYAAGRRADPW